MSIRFAVVFVAFGLLMFALSGCDSGATDQAKSPDTRPPTADQPKETTPVDAPAAADAPAPGPKDPSAQPAKPPAAKPASDDKYAVRRDVTYADVKPARDDTLLVCYGNDPDSLNVVTSSDTVSSSFQRRVYEGLADQNFANPDILDPSLATHWEFDEEKLEFTIHLRKGVKWHPMRLPNGELLPAKEFSARDVKFTFDCVLNPHVEAAHIRSYYEDPEAEDVSKRYKIVVTKVDNYTIKVRWRKPYFLAKEFTLGGFGIIPRHVYSVDATGEPISFDFSSKEFADGFNNHWANKSMCGTGPMMFKQWEQNKRLVLVRFADYWGSPYYFSQVISRCIPNPNTMTQKLLQNELDFTGIAQKDQYIQSRANPNVKSGKVKLISYDYPGYRYIGYNLKRNIFKDRKFRLALSHAVPVQTIIDEVFKGLAIPIAGPFMPGSSACDNTLKPIPYDLEAAKRLLDEAGWKDTDEDGIRDKMLSGVKVPARFDLMIYSDAPAYRTIAEIIKENCRKVGVEVLISPAKWALMLQKLRKREFDAAMLGWALSWKADPFQLWHGSQADISDSSNHVGYSNPEVDKLIEQLRETLDESKQIELYHKIHRIIYREQPYTFLFADKATGGYDSRIENVKFYKIRPCVDGREWYSSRPRMLGP